MRSLRLEGFLSEAKARAGSWGLVQALFRRREPGREHRWRGQSLDELEGKEHRNRLRVQKKAHLTADPPDGGIEE